MFRRTVTPPALGSLPTPDNLRYRRACAGLRRILLAVIEEHRTLATDHGGFLSVLLTARDPETGDSGLSDDEILDELVTFFIAGTDTTGLTLSRALHLPPRSAFIPFGGGARKCIGDQFGVTEAVLSLATIAARRRLAPLPGRPVRTRADLMLGPRGLRLRAVSRVPVGPGPTTGTR
ncbi:cytochrome P450 [Kitasatospora purpeofusca]|uniref:cytochrome P450 n=1 Tax=Kitasatospora purpeofusca TaxID=67352 RepID=UPI0035DB1200